MTMAEICIYKMTLNEGGRNSSDSIDLWCKKGPDVYTSRFLCSEGRPGRDFFLAILFDPYWKGELERYFDMKKFSPRRMKISRATDPFAAVERRGHMREGILYQFTPLPEYGKKILDHFRFNDFFYGFSVIACRNNLDLFRFRMIEDYKLENDRAKFSSFTWKVVKNFDNSWKKIDRKSWRSYYSNCGKGFFSLADIVTNLERPLCPLKMVCYDIEILQTHTRGTWPHPDNSEDHVGLLSLAFFDGEKYSGGVDLVNLLSEKHVADIEINDEQVLLFSNEEELLEKFLDLILEAELLTGWNINAFDAPFLKQRLLTFPAFRDILEKIVPDNYLSRPIFSNMFESDISSTSLKFPHQMQLDGLLYKKLLLLIKTSDKLNDVGAALNLGTKEDISFKIANAVYRSLERGTITEEEKAILEKLIKYCRQDARLAGTIMASNIQDLRVMSDFSHMNCEDVIASVNYKMKRIDEGVFYFSFVQGYPVSEIFTKQQTNESVFSKLFKTEIKRKYRGALVLDPQPAVYHGRIFAFDVKSLYPNMIRQYNLGEWSTFECNDNFFKRHEKFLRRHFHVCDLEYGKVCSIKELEPGERGFIISFEDEMLRLRDDVKKRMGELKKSTGLTTEEAKLTYNLADSFQKNYKLMANGMYGKLGQAKEARGGGFLFNHAVAAATTTWGQITLKNIIDVSLEKRSDGKILYGDTDSIFFFLRGENGDREERRRVGQEICDFINSRLPEYVNVEFERSCELLIIAAKKRYVMYDGLMGGGTKFSGVKIRDMKMLSFCQNLAQRMFEEILKSCRAGETRYLIAPKSAETKKRKRDAENVIEREMRANETHDAALKIFISEIRNYIKLFSKDFKTNKLSQKVRPFFLYKNIGSLLVGLVEKLTTAGLMDPGPSISYVKVLSDYGFKNNVKVRDKIMFEKNFDPKIHSVDVSEMIRDDHLSDIFKLVYDLPLSEAIASIQREILNEKMIHNLRRLRDICERENFELMETTCEFSLPISALLERKLFVRDVTPVFLRGRGSSYKIRLHDTRGNVVLGKSLLDFEELQKSCSEETFFELTLENLTSSELENFAAFCAKKNVLRRVKGGKNFLIFRCELGVGFFEKKNKLYTLKRWFYFLEGSLEYLEEHFPKDASFRPTLPGSS